MYLENPFTPSFGEVPAHLAGRKQIVDDLLRAFSSERRRPELTTLLSGARGTGKTTLLSLLAAKAESLGWAVVDTTALPGMLEDIEIGARRNASHLLKPATRKVAGFEISPLGGMQLEPAEKPRDNWRFRITDLLDQLEAAGSGLLVTVDEVDPALPDMVELVAVYQHLIREGRKVALLMAGLPHNISALLNDKTVSFLRRAQLFRLGRIADYDVEAALVKTVVEQGRSIDEPALAYAVDQISGFPFMLQLVGYRSWDINPSSSVISIDDVTAGAAQAKCEMDDRILGATYRELSAGDLEFLAAMLEDGDASRISDIVTRLGKSDSSVSQFRRRLIDAGVIGERGRGVIGFELPYFREYLEERL